MFGISKILITGVHGYQTIRVVFTPGLNVIHGKNGVGKTTLLHIIANAINCDFARFLHLKFSNIIIRSLAGNCIRLEHVVVNERPEIRVWLDKKLRHVTVDGELPAKDLVEEMAIFLGPQAVYVPAFRTILEGSFNQRGFESRFESAPDALTEIVKHQIILSGGSEGHYNGIQYQQRIEQNAAKTLFCRRFFGAFIPVIRYQTLGEARMQIEREIREAWLELSSFDQEALANFAINTIATVVRQKPTITPNAYSIQHINDRIQKLLEDQRTRIPEAFEVVKKLVQPHSNNVDMEANPVLGPILSSFAATLEDRSLKQAKVFQKLRKFEDSLNRFLENKKVDFAQPEARRGPRITLSNNKQTNLSVMSSGERHVFSILFAATHIGSSDGIILIDEPELSLHLDWQRTVLSELLNQCEGRQMIVCTHSGEVAAEHLNSMIEIKLREWNATSEFVEMEFDELDAF
jgi:predicted ATPase